VSFQERGPASKERNGWATAADQRRRALHRTRPTPHRQIDGDAGWGFLVGVPSFAGEVPGWVPVRKTCDVILSANRLANRQKWGECTSWTPRMFAQGRQACIASSKEVCALWCRSYCCLSRIVLLWNCETSPSRNLITTSPVLEISRLTEQIPTGFRASVCGVPAVLYTQFQSDPTLTIKCPGRANSSRNLITTSPVLKISRLTEQIPTRFRASVCRVPAVLYTQFQSDPTLAIKCPGRANSRIHSSRAVRLPR